MAQSYQARLLVREAKLTSPWFHNMWTLESQGEVLAEIQRMGRIHVSTVMLPDGSRWVIEPHGASTVRAIDGPDHEFARITRRSWWGRRWDVSGPTFAYELVSHPIPRRWAFMLGDVPIARLAGSMVSYNKVDVDLLLTMPMVAVVLAWHVIARPWDQAAAPGALVPAPRPPQRRTDQPNLPPETAW